MGNCIQYGAKTRSTRSQDCCNASIVHGQLQCLLAAEECFPTAPSSTNSTSITEPIGVKEDAHGRDENVVSSYSPECTQLTMEEVLLPAGDKQSHHDTPAVGSNDVAAVASPSSVIPLPAALPNNGGTADVAALRGTSTAEPTRVLPMESNVRLRGSRPTLTIITNLEETAGGRGKVASALSEAKSPGQPYEDCNCTPTYLHKDSSGESGGLAATPVVPVTPFVPEDSRRRAVSQMARTFLPPERESGTTDAKAIASGGLLSTMWVFIVKNRSKNVKKKVATSKKVTQQSRANFIRDGALRLERRLEALNLVTHHVSNDGNCQFRAISHQLLGSQDYHDVIRCHVVSYMRSMRKEMFDCYFESTEAADEYFRSMAKDGTWGDELTLRGASDSLYINIHVLSSSEHHCYITYRPAVDARKPPMFLVDVLQLRECRREERRRRRGVMAQQHMDARGATALTTSTPPAFLLPALLPVPGAADALPNDPALSDHAEQLRIPMENTATELGASVPAAVKNGVGGGDPHGYNDECEEEDGRDDHEVDANAMQRALQERLECSHLPEAGDSTGFGLSTSGSVAAHPTVDDSASGGPSLNLSTELHVTAHGEHFHLHPNCDWAVQPSPTRRLRVPIILPLPTEERTSTDEPTGNECNTPLQVTTASSEEDIRSAHRDKFTAAGAEVHTLDAAAVCRLTSHHPTLDHCPARLLQTCVPRSQDFHAACRPHDSSHSTHPQDEKLTCGILQPCPQRAEKNVSDGFTPEGVGPEEENGSLGNKANVARNGTAIETSGSTSDEGPKEPRCKSAYFLFEARREPTDIFLSYLYPVHYNALSVRQVDEAKS